MNQNKGGRPKTFPDITEDEYKKFRNVSRRVRKRDQTGSYNKKLERLQKNGDLQNFRQTDAERNKVYKTKKLEIKRSQEALMMQDKIQTRGIMETVENLCVLTPDKRKRLVESQTSKKSTPEEIAATTAYVNSLSPTTLNDSLYHYNSAISKLKSQNKKATKKRIAEVMKESTEKTIKFINLNDESVEIDIYKSAFQYVKKTIFNPTKIAELLQQNVKTINVSGVDLVLNKLAKSFGVDLGYERTSLQNERSWLALGLFHELLSFGNEGFVIEPDYVVLPVSNVLKLIIKNAGLLESHGRTLQDIELGNVPSTIHFVGTSDGAEGVGHSGNFYAALRMIDEKIAKQIKLGDKDDTLFTKIQSYVGVLLIGVLRGLDNAENNYKVCYENWKELQRLNENNVYLEIKEDNGNGKYFKIDTVFNGDKKQFSTNCQAGGSSANSKYMCPYCTCGSHIKGHPALFKCQRCIRKSRICYCCAIFTSTEQALYKNRLQEPDYSRFTVSFPKSSDKVEVIDLFIATHLHQYLNENQKFNRKDDKMSWIMSQEKEWYVISPEIDRISENGNSNVEKTLRFYGIQDDVQVDKIFNDNYDLMLCQQSTFNELDSNGHTEHEYYSVNVDQLNIEFKRRSVLKYVYQERYKLLYVLNNSLKEKAKYKVIYQIERQHPCMMHSQIRIGGSKSMTMMFLDIPNNEKTERMAKVNNLIKNILRGVESPTSDETIIGNTCTFNAAYGEEFKISCARQDKILENIEIMVKTVFNKEVIEQNENDRAFQWLQYFNKYKELLVIQSQKEAFTDEQVEHFDDVQYSYCKMFIRLMGTNGITGYLHDYRGSHNTWFLWTFRNFFLHCQIAMEASVGRTRAFLTKGINMGHTGDGHNNLSEMNAVLSHMCRDLAFFVCNLNDNPLGTKDEQLKRLVKNGKIEKKLYTINNKNKVDKNKSPYIVNNNDDIERLIPTNTNGDNIDY